MSLKKTKNGRNCEIKPKQCPSPSQSSTVSSPIVPRKTIVPKKDHILSVNELENLNIFLSSQLIAEANLKFGATPRVEKPGFCGWSLVDTKFSSGDTLNPKNEVLKQKRTQHSLRGRRDLACCTATSSIRWSSSPPPVRTRQLNIKSAADNRALDAHRLILHSHMDRFIEDYRELKLKSLRESKSVIALGQRHACSSLRGRPAECGWAINEK